MHLYLGRQFVSDLEAVENGFRFKVIFQMLSGVSYFESWTKAQDFARPNNGMIIDLKPSHGGPREGAGRPATGRNRKQFYVTDEEEVKLRTYLDEMRKEIVEMSIREKIKAVKAVVGPCNPDNPNLKDAKLIRDMGRAVANSEEIDRKSVV